jgi:glycosyltransferase involved in cell wall biosynthesis
MNNAHQAGKRSPAITVLMSVHNGARWLDQAISSVLNQTLIDFEFIIVNDGSTDQSLEIIKRFARSDPRIVVIDKPNTGLADSLNRGIREARGQWVARVDADDLCEPNRLEEQFNYVKSKPEVVLVGSDFIEIDNNGTAIKRQSYPSNHTNLIWNLEHHKRFFPHSSAFFRLDIAWKVGGYNIRIHRSQDHDFWFRLSSEGKITCLKKPLVRIRKHDNQISNEESGMKQVYYDYAATVCHFLRKKKQVDPSMVMNEDNWVLFLKWLKNEVDREITIIDRRIIWKRARAQFYEEKNRLLAFIRFVREIVSSGYGCELLKEKFFGTTLPKHLAYRWTAKEH